MESDLRHPLSQEDKLHDDDHREVKIAIVHLPVVMCFLLLVRMLFSMIGGVRKR